MSRVSRFYFYIADCKWAGWEEWSTCTKSCGGGTQLRTRIVETYQNAGGNCSGESLEEQECQTEICPLGIKIIIMSEILRKRGITDR